MQKQLTRRERATLKSWWPHLNMKVKGDNLIAQHLAGEEWSVLLTLEQAKVVAATQSKSPKEDEANG